MPTARTASAASMTLPGPTGKPAARSTRANCIKLSTRRPRCSPGEDFAGIDLRPSAALGGGDFDLDLLEDLHRLAALDLGDVVLVLEERSERGAHVGGVVRHRVELRQRLGAIDRLGDAGELEQIF